MEVDYSFMIKKEGVGGVFSYFIIFFSLKSYDTFSPLGIYVQ